MMELLRAENITKHFPGVLALNHVSLHLNSGDVLALIGENGAGKSTLVKILSGAYQQDDGEIWLKGTSMGKMTPRRALDCGIAVIYQELNYMPYMTVAENLFLGNPPIKHGIVDYHTLKKDSIDILKSIGLGYIDPFSKVQKMTTAEKQLLEISRAVTRNADILILDEPTSALNDREIEVLFEQIRTLQKQGKGIIYISHKIEEIFHICNKIQIMRDGRVVYTGRMNDIGKEDIISYMVGRNIKDMYPITPRPLGKHILEVNRLQCSGVKDISLNVNAGEIVGLYGLLGSGCEEVLKSLFGIVKKRAQNIFVSGKKVSLQSPIDAIRSGIAYAPGERKTEGLILGQSVRSNITAVTLKKYRKFRFILNLKKERAVAQKWVEALNVKTQTVETPAVSLSGGNQQKVILARWLNNKPKLFLMNEPTRGIDIGAKVEIYKRMESICKSGCGILLVTSDLTELVSICDRVYVLREGTLAGEYTKSQINARSIMKSAVGV